MMAGGSRTWRHDMTAHTLCRDSTIQCPPVEFPSRTVWAAARTYFADAVREYRIKQAARQFERLDPNILRDIGVTRLGARASAPELSREIAGSGRNG